MCTWTACETFGLIGSNQNRNLLLCDAMGAGRTLSACSLCAPILSPAGIRCRQALVCRCRTGPVRRCEAVPGERAATSFLIIGRKN